MRNIYAIDRVTLQINYASEFLAHLPENFGRLYDCKGEYIDFGSNSATFQRLFLVDFTANSIGHIAPKKHWQV